MSIRLNWIDRNTAVDSVAIYRDIIPLVPATLPAAIATLTAGETTYDDTTAVRNVLYYYGFTVKRGTDSVFSSVRPVVNMPYTGPGPQELMRGDWEQGYFGDVSTTDMFGAIELQQLVGFGTTAGLEVFVWHKFAYRGKVLYFPSQHLSLVSWNMLYGKGLVFGMDSVGPTGHSNPPVNQMVRVAKGDDQFIVRLPRTNLTPLYVNGPYDYKSEFVQCIGALWGLYFQDPVRMLGTLNGLSWTSTANTPCAEFTTGALSGTMAGLNSSPTTFISSGRRDTAGYAWRPVLEYIAP